MRSLHFSFIIILCISSFTNCNTTPANSKIDQSEAALLQDSIEVKLELVTNAIEMPVELNVSNDGTQRKFITDIKGKIWILKNDSLLAKPFLNLYDKLGKQDSTSSIGSISSITFHPEFAKNHQFFICYNAPSTINPKMGKLVVSSFTVNESNPDLADLESEYEVFELEGKNIGANLCQISFGPDGFLYISIGDDKIGDSTYVYHAQDLNYFNGKLLRIDVNKRPYTIPANNPFVNTKNAKPEIWAYGLRKLWRYTFDPVSNQLFGADVGELNQEEIDIITSGKNFGWPIKEGYGKGDLSDSNNTTIFTSPICAYSRETGICIIGGSFYYGEEIPTLKNKYVFADFNGSLHSLVKSDTGSWNRQPLKLINNPEVPFLICGFNADENNILYVMGMLNTKTGTKGVVYKIKKA